MKQREIEENVYLDFGIFKVVPEIERTVQQFEFLSHFGEIGLDLVGLNCQTVCRLQLLSSSQILKLISEIRGISIYESL